MLGFPTDRADFPGFTSVDAFLPVFFLCMTGIISTGGSLGFCSTNFPVKALFRIESFRCTI